MLRPIPSTRSLPSLFPLLLAGLLAGCVSRQANVQIVGPQSAQVQQVQPVSQGPQVQAVPGGNGAIAASAPMACHAQISVGRVQTRGGCTIDERVSGHQATLEFQCGGGAARADFGGSLFTGQVEANNQIDIRIETQFPFQDGCTWESKQRITGDMISGQLDYTYVEQPVPGQRGCARACSAEAQVQISVQ